MTTGGKNSRLQSECLPMIPKYDIEYSLAREAEERLASKNATNDSARIAHTKLADCYAERAWSARQAQYEEALSVDNTNNT